MAKKPDPEMVEFQAALLRSVEQAAKGQYARVHTPEEIAARQQDAQSPSRPTITHQPDGGSTTTSS